MLKPEILAQEAACGGYGSQGGAENPPFWLVWSDGSPATIRFSSEELALGEARDRACRYPGVNVFVLQPTALVVRGGLSVTRYAKPVSPF